MLELWMFLAVLVWVALMTLVVTLCVASGRADRVLGRALRPGRRRPGRYTTI